MRETWLTPENHGEAPCLSAMSHVRQHSAVLHSQQPREKPQKKIRQGGHGYVYGLWKRGAFGGQPTGK